MTQLLFTTDALAPHGRARRCGLIMHLIKPACAWPHDARVRGRIRSQHPWHTYGAVLYDGWQTLEAMAGDAMRSASQKSPPRQTFLRGAINRRIRTRRSLSMARERGTDCDNRDKTTGGIFDPRRAVGLVARSAGEGARGHRAAEREQPRMRQPDKSGTRAGRATAMHANPTCVMGRPIGVADFGPTSWPYAEIAHVSVTRLSDRSNAAHSMTAPRQPAAGEFPSGRRRKFRLAFVDLVR
jgi:hypothetical protein